MQPSTPAELLLGPMLRYVDAQCATVWVETSRPCTVCVLGSSARTFTVNAHHFALVVVEGLEPDTVTEYRVHLDGAQVWPGAGSTFPPSVIRTKSAGSPVSVLVGSCRAAAPHEPPYTLELAFNADGRGVDTLWAHAQRMAREPVVEWPDLLLLVGDQVYADDSSPGAKARIEARRADEENGLPAEVVSQFDEYCWLYHEAWTEPWERWLLSTVPSAMIFDDHDMIDDWNISQSWVTDIRRESWWDRHVVDGLASYWIYQHLGNLSPDQIRAEGILDTLTSVCDGTKALEDWARQSETFTPVPGGYRFSFARQVGDVTIVVVDCRNSRVLTHESRLMVGADEWQWIREQALAASGHIVFATSLPLYIADGLHDLQVWNERVCHGAWGRRLSRWGERIRRGLDLEDWSAFAESYDRFQELIADLGRAAPRPRSIIVASGDIHFSYAARVTSAATGDGPEPWQIVSSPIRNALIPQQRGILRMSLTRFGSYLGDLLRRSVRAPRTRPGIRVEAGPFFANNMCELHYRGDEVRLVIEQSAPNGDGEPELHAVADLVLQEATQ